MDLDKAEEQLKNQVNVTNLMVTYAKAYYLKNYSSKTDQLIESLLINVDARKPERIVIHDSVNTAEQLSKAAKHISWRLGSRLTA